MKQIEKYISQIASILNCNIDMHILYENCAVCPLLSLCKNTQGKSKEEKIKYLNSNVDENKLSIDEYFILKNFDANFKWISRDESGELFVYCDKPFKKGTLWRCKDPDWYNFRIYNHLFQFIRWSDDEPYEIEKLIESYKEGSANDR